MKVKKAGVGLGLVTAIGVLAGGYAWSHRLQPITSYDGVSLTDNKADVEYELGTPDRVLTSAFGFVQLDNPVQPWSQDNDWHDTDQWSYDTKVNGYDEGMLMGKETDIYFQKGQVVRIGCGDSSDIVSPNDGIEKCPAVYGFATGATEGQIRAKLGEPDIVKTTDGWRLIVYKRLNVSFELLQSKLAFIDIGQPPSDWNP